MSLLTMPDLSYEEFLRFQDGDDTRYELVKGRVHAMTGAKIQHDRVTRSLITALSEALTAAGSACELFTADVGVRTGRASVRRPEVSVVCPPIDPNASTTDAPVLVVEVLSESTAAADRGVKMREYKALPSLHYVMLLDPETVMVEFHSRRDDGRWLCQVYRTRDGVLAMPRLRLTIQVEAAYRFSPDVTPDHAQPPYPPPRIT